MSDPNGHDESICNEAHGSVYGTAASLAMKRFSEAFEDNLVLATEMNPEQAKQYMHHLASSMITHTEIESRNHHTGDYNEDEWKDKLAIFMVGFLFGRAIEEMSVVKLADAHELTFQP